MLVPGAYETDDFLQESGRKLLTYGFKGIEREQGPKIGHGYGDKVHNFPALKGCLPALLRNIPQLS